MGFLGVIFVIILVCALIGTENIITILAIGIPAAIVIFVAYQIWSWKSAKEDEKKEDEVYRSTCWNGYFNQVYATRPMVTGDYYKWSPENDKYSRNYCKYANSSNCANCSRRREQQKDGLYYYGASSDCWTLND